VAIALATLAAPRSVTVLGATENDQIHFFYHFLEGRKGHSVSYALRHTFLISGKAIFFATIINAGGFLAFAMSEMRPMQQFGVLTATAPRVKARDARRYAQLGLDESTLRRSGKALVAALRAHLHAHTGGLDACGPLRGHLARLLPELGEPAAESDRATLFEALHCALAGLGHALVLLDDLQWSDEATLEVLAALGESVTTSRLLIVASYRSDGLPRGHGLRRLRHDLRRAGRLEEIALPPLGLAETRELVARVLPLAPGPDLVRAIHDRTEGVPFFARELAIALCVSGALRETPAGLELAGADEVPLPDTIRDAVMLRLAELTDGARRAIEAAAVAGTSFDLRLVAEIAGEAALTERGVSDRPIPVFGYRDGVVSCRYIRASPTCCSNPWR